MHPCTQTWSDTYFNTISNGVWVGADSACFHVIILHLLNLVNNQECPGSEADAQARAPSALSLAGALLRPLRQASRPLLAHPKAVPQGALCTFLSRYLLSLSSSPFSESSSRLSLSSILTLLTERVFLSAFSSGRSRASRPRRLW